MNFLRIESFKRGIVVSTVFNLLAKGLLFSVSLLVAFYFGSTSQTDVYFYAYNVVVLISGFFTMLNTTVLIPEAMRIRIENRQESSHFLVFFIYLYFALALLITLIFFISPVYTFTTISNFDAGSLEENVMILRLATPLILLMTLTNFLTEILISYRFFTVTMIVSIVNSVISIAFLFFFRNQLNISSLLIGLLTGFCVNLVALVIVMRVYLKWEFYFAIYPVGKRIWRNVGLAQAGNITSILNSYVPLFLLSGFSPGIITALTFAQQLSILPNSLLINHFTTVAGIKFNELYTSRNFSMLSQIFVDTSNFLVFILMTASCIMFLFSSEIITVIFEHGEFNETGAEYASFFLKYLSLQLPFLAINALFGKLFSASYKVAHAFWYQMTTNILLIVCMIVLISKMGIMGYPLALLVIYFFNLFACYFLEKRYLKIVAYEKVLANFFYLALVNVAISTIVLLSTAWISAESDLIKLLSGSFLYLILLYAFNVLFKLNETILSAQKALSLNVNLGRWIHKTKK